MDTKSFLNALVVGISIVIFGYFVGSGLKRFSSTKDGSITVKGLAEETVISDFAMWKIEIDESGRTIEEAEKKFQSSLSKLDAFLIEQGFKKEEIQAIVPIVADLTLKDFTTQDANRPKYSISGGYVTSTTNVQAVAQAINNTAKLISAGLHLVGGTSYEGNPRYFLKKFNEYRGPLLASATVNARHMAESFAKDSGAKVGRLLHANQGVIETLSDDGSYASEKTLHKNLRVVSTLTFELV